MRSSLSSRRRTFAPRYTFPVILTAALASGVACSGTVDGPGDGLPPEGATLGAPDLIVDAKLDRSLSALLAKGGQAMPRQLVNLRRGSLNGAPAAFVDVFMRAEISAVPQLRQLGAEIHSVTKSGVMTATVPVPRLRAMAALAEVSRIEAGKRMNKLMDVSTAETGLNVPAGMRPDGAAHTGGAGVVVGVLDTGIDWSHADFRNENGSTRVYAVWDQSDYGDGNPPGDKKDYGYVYAQEDIQACIDGTGSYCAQEDTDGHGTHVTGTAAGNGRAHGDGTSEYQYAGVAPEATIVSVKFDFDGDRNSDTAIIDGIDWIFEKADELGLPAVINLSLGSDFGPHDGSTLEEIGISDLTASGKIVVAAAGNPGRNHDSPNRSLWGRPLHGSGTIPENGYSEITVEVDAAAGEDDYVFFDIWYGGLNKTQIQVITPSGAAYPPDFSGRNKRTWITGSTATYFATGQGSIVVGNGGDQLGWGSSNGDHELYVELSDYNNFNPVASGTWTIRIYDRGLGESGDYHGWYGASDALIETLVTYDGSMTDNVMTAGTPATAQQVIAIGAYTTKMRWEYLDLNGTDGTCDAGTPCCMTYNEGALNYYDPFYLDTDGDGTFDYTPVAGACTLTDPEPYHLLAFFSARGPMRESTGRAVPTVSAPGVGIVASLSQAALAAEMAEDDVNNTYFRRTNRVLSDGLHAVLQGTSMACPHGTGSVALLLEQNPALTPAEVRTLLQDSARTDDGTGAVPNDDWGYGKLDVTEALSRVEPPAEPECTLAADCPATGNSCTEPTCVGGVCGTQSVADGTACGTSDVCCSGTCSSPACASDADCGDDVCQNAGTCDAACVAAGCQGDPCTTDAECCDGYKCVGKPGHKTCKGG